MTVRDRIELRPRNRPPAAGGLLAAASPITGDWWRGVTFSGNGCAEPTLRGPCEDELSTGSPVPMEPGSPGDAETFVPVNVLQGILCSTLSNTDMSDLSEARLAYAREWAVGHILQTGDHTEHTADGSGADNPALVDATDVDTDVLDIVDAVACLEQHAADELFGSTAFIHASPLLMTHIMGRRLLWRDGNLWRTAVGSVVVSSPGYAGVELYVTGEVYAMAGEGQTSDPQTGIDRTTNTMTAWAQELVLAVFDPCWSGRVTTDVALCDTPT